MDATTKWCALALLEFAFVNEEYFYPIGQPSTLLEAEQAELRQKGLARASLYLAIHREAVVQRSCQALALVENRALGAMLLSAAAAGAHRLALTGGWAHLRGVVPAAARVYGAPLGGGLQSPPLVSTGGRRAAQVCLLGKDVTRGR